MAMSENIPSYKLRFPEERESIPRSRLFDYLDGRVERKLLVVHGRAGQGKTSLIYTYLKSRGKDFSWYTVDAWDSTARRFAEGLAACLDKYRSETETSPADKSAGKEAEVKEAAAERDEGELPEEILLRKVGEAVKRDHYLVIDDFHLIDPEGEAHEFLRRILPQLPSYLHMVLLSRRVPTIELARLRGRREVAEISDEDLSFSEEEVQLFFQKNSRILLSGSLLERLYRFVGGWITGYVYLVERLEGLDQDEREPFLEEFLQTGKLKEIDDFFREEILKVFSDTEREVIYQLGAIKQPGEELVELIAGDAQTGLLEKLMENHAFIRLVDQGRGKYAFEELFYRYLEQEFRSFDRNKRTKTVRQISDYFEKRKGYRRLVWYLLCMGEFERARDYFIKYADELYAELGQDKLRIMLESFPEEMRESEQALAYYYDLSTSLVRPVTTTRRLLGMVPAFRESKEYEKIVSIFSVLLMNSLFYQRSNEAMEEIVSQADVFLREYGEQIKNEHREILESLIPLGKWKIGENEDLAFRTALQVEATSFKLHNQAAYLCAQLVLSRIYIEKGAFLEAKKILQRTEAFLETNRVGDLFRLLLAFSLGDTFFYLGEIGTAIEWIEQALKQCPDDFAFRYYLELNLIIYNLYQEDISKADALFELTEHRETDEILLVKYFSNYYIQMLIAYRSKNNERTTYYAERLLEPENEALLRTDFPYSYLALSEVLIFLGKCEEARGILEPLLTEEFMADHPYPAVSAKALLALCLEKKNEKKEMAEILKSMVDTIVKQGYRNLDIVDPDILNHLADLADNPVFAEFPRLAARREKAARNGQEYDLVIKTLGSFRVYIKGREITTSLLSSQKRVMDLLKLLIVHRKNGVMKEKVYEIFWPRYSYKSVRDNLNTIIYRLRKILGSDVNFLATDVNMIYFKDGRISIDIDDFLKYYDRARTAEHQGNLEAAVSLYRMADELYEGDFLSGDLYFDFIRDQREELKNRHRQVLFSLTRISLSTGEYGNAVDWAKKLIAEDSLCEPAYRLLMIASAFSGNRSVIPRFFETLNRRLMEAYNLSADERTETLKNRLLYGPPVDSSFWEEERLI